MNNIAKLKNELLQAAKPEKALLLAKYFQAFPGGYGENDVFIGISVPEQRSFARKYARVLTLKETSLLLNEQFHEYRLTAIFMLVLKFQQSKQEEERKNILDVYIENIQKINNWDLVDSSAHHIIGAFLWDKPKDLLYEFAVSEHLWTKRIAIIATYFFIKKNEFTPTIDIAKILLNDSHDLIHKAVGWMLREIGNRDFQTAFDFLKIHYKNMPRTMLRYAIEKFEENLRQDFLKGNI